MESPQPTRSSNVTAVVAIFLGVIRAKQKALCEPLGLSESQVSRKMKSGVWTVDDVDRLAVFFGVAVSDFFEDPEVIRSRMLGSSPLPWITAPTEGDIPGISVTECEGQGSLDDEARELVEA